MQRKMYNSCIKYYDKTIVQATNPMFIEITFLQTFKTWAMKKNISFLSTLLAMVLFLTTAGAQTSTYERIPGYYTFGINAGWAYQDADIPTTLDGYGLGFTLGKNIYYRPGSALSFDVRGRALYSQTVGLDYNRSYGILDNDALNGERTLDYTKDAGSTGFVFQNNKTHHGELAVEGVVSFNKLRENTNVILSLYGGIGLGWYQARTDQSNRQGLYTDDYLALDTLSSVSFIKSQLKNNILDGDYEATANDFGRIKAMPAIGAELGYQFGPRFSMGVGHKMTFTQTDLFDGHQWTNDNNLTGDDDIHHYTNLHMRWIINDNSKKLREPIVDITNPALSPHTTRNATFNVRATIKYIESAMDIDFTVNGYRETFDYRKRDFRSLIRLQPGNNEVVITATNSAGSDREVVNIFYEEPGGGPNTYAYPNVEFTNPSYDDFRTDQRRFEVRAQIDNVYSRNDINFIVNGYDISNFDFSNGRLTANIDLRDGRNEVRIEGRNQDGFDADETTIILEDIRPTRPPYVDITKPSVNPYETNNRNVSIEANISNVNSRNDIRFVVRGFESNNFDYSNGVLYANITLDNYRTEVVISANNDAGQDDDSVTIIWEEDDNEPTVERPVVTITSVSAPTVDPFNTDNCRSTVIATILNIEDRNDIDFYVNGQRLTNFDFNASTQVFKSTVNLEKGNNTIRVRANNTAGFDEDSANTQGCDVQTDPVRPPTVKITSPRNNSTVEVAELRMTASVAHVNRQSDIQIFNNGRLVNNFTFLKNELEANVVLAEGNNTLRVVVSNNDGTAEDMVQVRYVKPAPELPTVRIERPKNNSQVEVAEVRLIADVTRVNRRSDIQVFNNGRLVNNFTFLKNEINANIVLAEGNNTLRVTVSNNDGTAEDMVQIRYVKPLPQKPSVDIEKPRNNQEVSDSKITLVADVKRVRGKQDIEVLLNGRRVSNFTFVNQEVSARLSLVEGKNSITVKARNEGGAAEDRVTVTYEKPRPKPNVSITKPTNNTTVDQEKIQVVASITNVDSKRNISLKVNGRSQKFSYIKGRLTADISLKKGRNTIAVKASNTGGSDEESVSVTYKPKVVVPKPTVKFTSPTRPGGTVKKERYTVKASVKNVTSKNDIKFIVNKKGITNFTFDARRKEVYAVVTLIEGKNEFYVKATNESGKTEATTTVIYKKPVVQKYPPKVNIVSVSDPTVDPFDPNKARSTVIAKLDNVGIKRQITFLFNGKKVTNYAFNKKTKTLTITLDLKRGENTFVIKASNKDGADEASRKIQWGDSGSGSINSRNDHKNSGGGVKGGKKSRRG